jgi:hypothetical protein
VLAHHPHDLLRRARSLGLQGAELQAALAEIYALSPAQIEPVIAALGAAPA